MLLNMEKQVATFTGRKEVRELAQTLAAQRPGSDGEILAEPTNVIGVLEYPRSAMISRALTTCLRASSL